VIAQVAGRLKSIAVIAPRTSGRVKPNERTHFRAAQQLHSDFELSGTVSRMNGWMRITARLVRLRDQNCIWTQSYLRPDQDFFAVQEEIAKNISQAIGPMIAPNVGTVPVW
jgi:TolB-like protein